MPIDLNPDLFTDLAIGLAEQPLQGFPERFYILDCETTGGKALRDHMTELAWIKIEHGKIAGHWHSLFDPQTTIPPWITNITGIHNSMVHDAPTFAQMAEEIAEQLDGEIIVAHNARFDYGFLKNEFKRCGKAFNARTLCSVKISRKLYPQVKGHGLDKVLQRLRLTLQNRHRAMSDVLAVLAFFRKISQQFDGEEIEAVCQSLLKTAALPSHLPHEEVQKLPNLAGVYYFYDEAGKLLYVGKSVDLKTRVLSHFYQDHQTATDLRLSKTLHHIDYQITPSDFGAQLLESQEVKRLRPSLNKRLKKATHLYQLRLQEDEYGYYQTKIVPVKEDADSGEQRFGLFRSQRQAKGQLEKLVKNHLLCQRLSGLEGQKSGSCFAFQLKKCLGACCQKEPVASYNLRVLEALQHLQKQVWPWSGPILVGERVSGQDIDENDESQVANHLVDQWCYFGKVRSEDEVAERLQSGLPEFDLDIYFILLRFLLEEQSIKDNGLQIRQLDQQLRRMA
ncbi:GIY-YIG nuclease family protein [Thiomicrorhabdus sp. 6S2-11]|jgi:DNA polymerase-3 subunit epsilon|uniref:Excinuclease cho n=1 Tax=Thiomicrorhabdus marina TaxID=2818442 RepID=A0ABS3Q5P1_9GAMM|nr:3'-5' exonuclease family protein [Thiomicrorhabdus marina]MBO1927634.1 GIY-YIG nuclease family protein [Thiomicrorhabdus marina]